jgi:hypothetical protein
VSQDDGCDQNPNVPKIGYNKTAFLIGVLPSFLNWNRAAPSPMENHERTTFFTP